MERYTSKKGPRNAAGGNRDGEHCPQRIEEERNRAPMHPEGSPNTPKGTPREVFFGSAKKHPMGTQERSTGPFKREYITKWAGLGEVGWDGAGWIGSDQTPSDPIGSDPFNRTDGVR